MVYICSINSDDRGEGLLNCNHIDDVGGVGLLHGNQLNTSDESCTRVLYICMRLSCVIRFSM